MAEWLTYIGTAAGIFVAIYLSYSAERRSRSAQAQSANAEAIAKADKARSEYVALLEGELELVKAKMETCLKRVGVLEISEAVCQQERIALLGENATFRRRLEALEKK